MVELARKRAYGVPVKIAYKPDRANDEVFNLGL